MATLAPQSSSLSQTTSESAFSSSSSESLASRALRRISKAASMMDWTSSPEGGCFLCSSFTRRSSTLRSWIPATRTQHSPFSYSATIRLLVRKQRYTPDRSKSRKSKKGFLHVSGLDSTQEFLNVDIKVT